MKNFFEIPPHFLHSNTPLLQILHGEPISHKSFYSTFKGEGWYVKLPFE